MTTVLDIRDRVRGDVLDYQQLLTCLREYAKPRDKIRSFLADGSLIRLRKGLYVFGDRYRRAPLSREYLANLICGPSYVSLDYCLSFYGLIPERVDEVTSVILGERRSFRTPLGVFTYLPMNACRYPAGMVWAGEGDARFLMASAEKALVDKIWLDKRIRGMNLEEFETYLFDDLRLDAAQVAALDYERLTAICAVFASRKIDLLRRYMDRQRRLLS